jgi:hypothetical protein
MSEMFDRIDNLTQRFAMNTATRLDRRRLLHRVGGSSFMGLALYLARGVGTAPARSLRSSTVYYCGEPQACGCPPHCGPSPCCVGGCSSLCTCDRTICTGGCTAYNDWSDGSNCWSCTDSGACLTTTCCDCHRTTSTHCICAIVTRACDVTDTPVLVWANGGPVDPPEPVVLRYRHLERAARGG